MTFYHDVSAWMLCGLLLWCPCVDGSWCFTMMSVHGRFITIYYDVHVSWHFTKSKTSVRGCFMAFYYADII